LHVLKDILIKKHQLYAMLRFVAASPKKGKALKAFHPFPMGFGMMKDAMKFLCAMKIISITAHNTYLATLYLWVVFLGSHFSMVMEVMLKETASAAPALMLTSCPFMSIRRTSS
jgi:hypothetical protein